METIRNIGQPIAIVPLTNKWHKNFQPMDANGEVPVSLDWFNGSSIQYQMVQPSPFAKQIDTGVSPVNPKVLNPRDFMKGGSI